MRRTIAVGLALSLIFVAPLAAAGAKPATPANNAKRNASKDGWPESRAGARAREWVEAFSSGEPAFRAWLGRSLTEESLAKRGLDARMSTYRELRERFGRLSFASVVKASPGELKVKLMASDASLNEFTFVVQIGPPYKLISVSRLEQRRRGGHGFHH